MKKILLSILLLFSIIFKAYSIPLDSTIHKSVSLFKSFIEKQEIDKKASIFTYTNDVTGSFEYINRGLPMLSNDAFYQQSLQIIQKIHTNSNNLYDNTKIYVFHGRYFLDINKNINKNTTWEEVKRNFTDKDKTSPIFLDQGKERYINDLTKEIGNVAAAKYPQNPCVIIYFTELIQAKRAEIDSPFNINNNYDIFSTNSTEYGKINYQLTRHIAYSFLNADHIKEKLSGIDFRQPLGTVNAPTQTSNYYSVLLKDILISIEQLLDARQATPAPVLCSACVAITEEGKKVENNAVAKETYYSHQGSLAYKAGWYKKTKYKEILNTYVENVIYIEGSCKNSMNAPCRSSDSDKEVLASRNASFFDKKNFSANFAEIFGELYNEKIAILGIPLGSTYSVFSPLDLAGGLLVRGGVSLASYGFRSLQGFSGIVYSRSVPYLFRAYANTQGYVYMYGLGISTAGSEVLAFAYGLGGADDEFPIPTLGDNVGKNIRIIWRSRLYDKIKGIIRVKEGVTLDKDTKKALISLVRKSIKQGKNIEVQVNAIDDILVDGKKWVGRIANITELKKILLGINETTTITWLEEKGIKSFFRGTTRSKADNSLFAGNTNSQALGISTSTDPIKATIFAIESATISNGVSKGVLQIGLPDDLKNIKLNAPNIYRCEKELEVVIQTSANNFANLSKVEISVENARKLIKEVYGVELDTRIDRARSDELLENLLESTLEKAYEFYQKAIKFNLK